MKMNKTVRMLLCLLVLVVALGTVAYAISAEISLRSTTAAPTVTADGVEIYSSGDTYGIRFDTHVTRTSDDGITIVRQGTLIIPLHIVGTEKITLQTRDVQNIVKNANDYYIYNGSNDYVYSAALVDVPAYALNAPICARSYVTYTVDGGAEQTVYGDTEIYDLYSLAAKADASDATANKIKQDLAAYQNTVATAAGSALTLTSPAQGETVYPYHDNAKAYLQASAASDTYVSVSGFKYSGTDAVKAIDITWQCTLEDVQSFTVAYATKADYSDAKYLWADESENSVSLYNLYKATTYYVKVLANLKDGTVKCTESTFKTTDLGPRVMHLDGSYNIRDLGGYMTASGVRTKQGVIYRSGQFNNYGAYDSTITTYGLHAVKDLGLKTELDFRGWQTSAIPNTTYKHIPVAGYDLASANPQKYIQQTFAFLADESNYPVIFHCQGGADRTGTIAYLYNALLGVDEGDLIRDYEFTSFSIYGLRTYDSTAYIAKDSYAFFETLEATGGETRQEQVELYLKSIGVTDEQIQNIRNIMLGSAN